MKDLDVRAINRNPVIVNINGVMPEDKLTPKMARRALEIAGARTGYVYDWDHNIAYRVYRNSARKLRKDLRLT